MTRKALLPSLMALFLAAPSFAGMPVPDLPRLDFGDPVVPCTPSQVCDPER